MEVKIIKEQIKRALEMFPDARNNDHMLLALIWHDELSPEERIVHMPLLDKISKGQMTNPESIRRTRQLVQVKFPELKGTNTEERHEHETEIKTQLYAKD